VVLRGSELVGILSKSGALTGEEVILRSAVLLDDLSLALREVLQGGEAISHGGCLEWLNIPVDNPDFDAEVGGRKKVGGGNEGSLM
jgi:hypothetical protein